MVLGAMVMVIKPGESTSSAEIGVTLTFMLIFPVGLGFSITGEGAGIFGLVLMGLSYICYIVMFVAFMYARTWSAYGALCIVFTVLLLLNVSGCREMNRGLSNITMRPYISTPQSVGCGVALAAHEGNIGGVHYGKIYGDSMQFSYYLNPSSNDRNIEFDPKQNLLCGLQSFEQVTAP